MEVCVVMVFRPQSTEPTGIGASTLDDKDKRHDQAFRNAWSDAMNHVVWGADELVQILSDDYVTRSTLHRRLTEKHGWKVVTSTVPC